MIYNLPQIIEKSALLAPNKVAFRCLDDYITFADLNVKANQLAAHLMEVRVASGDRVGIYMNRCLDTAIAVYGIFKCGAAFVPINPAMPLKATLAIMEDCDIVHLITTPSQKRKIKAIADASDQLKTVVGLFEEDLAGTTSVSWGSIFKKSQEAYEPRRILEQDLAFILYTSGSTGIPKGIMHSHYSGLSIAKLAVSLHDFTKEDIIGNFAPLHFDPSTFGFFASPLVCATTVIIPDAHMKLPVSLAALAAKEKITVWYSVPLTLTQVLLHGEIDKQDFSALRWVLFIGEVFPVKHLRALMKKWPHAKFNNLYGPAEVVACTYYIMDTPPSADKPIPIGTVWGNTDYKILDSQDQEVSQGEEGELLIRTSTLMNGYWNNPQLTEKSFFRVKIAPGYEHTYYRTGDQVRENEAGELMFLGRNDRQIKLRGYRIELDEIEGTLLKYPHVEEAAVVVIPAGEDNKELMAVIKLLPSSQIGVEQLIAYCKTYLPAYAVPNKMKVLQDFPRTGSGKINRPEIIEMLSS